MKRDWTKLCKDCGGCCGCFPLDNALLERFHDRLQGPAELVPLEAGRSMPVTPDGVCPFLARHNKICVIYADRPVLCRWFGENPALVCPKVDPKGARASSKKLLALPLFGEKP